MMKIREAKDQLSVIKYASGRYRSFIERECRNRWNSHANWEIDRSALPLHAWIASSDWVVTCDICREQIVIDYGEDYFCPNCLNAAHNGKARIVIFPEPKKRAEIERILLLRLNPSVRTWYPHETIDDLKAQNAEHGDKI
jgi:hypothetical protein